MVGAIQNTDFVPGIKGWDLVTSVAKGMEVGADVKVPYLDGLSKVLTLVDKVDKVATARSAPSMQLN